MCCVSERRGWRQGAGPCHLQAHAHATQHEAAVCITCGHAVLVHQALGVRAAKGLGVHLGAQGSQAGLGRLRDGHTHLGGAAAGVGGAQSGGELRYVVWRAEEELPGCLMRA
jgi:hypothetical protein